MKIRVLGSSAGGGFPQWNCNCRNCAGVRNGTVRARPRTQSSIAVTGGLAEGRTTTGSGMPWALVNASPDILFQLRDSPALQPARTVRDTGLAGIVLVDGQVDHSTGLYMLREATRPWLLWCTDSVYADLTRGNPILDVLSHYCGVDRQAMPLDGGEFVIAAMPGLRWRALPVASKPAPYSPNRAAPLPGDNVALVLSDERTGGQAFYAPGLAAIDESVWQAMRSCDCVLVDGTFWTDDEMIRLGLSDRRARDIGHLAQSGEGGMLEWLERLPAGTRKILVHINNTNPILDEDSPQRAECQRRKIEVAWDGLEIEL
jgi:pyrroloquinoline quinone biosynthesis protein B